MADFTFETLEYTLIDTHTLSQIHGSSVCLVPACDMGFRDAVERRKVVMPVRLSDNSTDGCDIVKHFLRDTVQYCLVGMRVRLRRYLAESG